MLLRPGETSGEYGKQADHGSQYGEGGGCHERSPFGDTLTHPTCRQVEPRQSKVLSQGYNLTICLPAQGDSWSELPVFY
jgi:hypothetical protein